MKRLLFILLLLVVFVIQKANAQSTYAGSAQTNKGDTINDFIPREKVIFEDDFSHDPVNAFPRRWHLDKCELKHTPIRPAFVEKIGEKYVVEVSSAESDHNSIMSDISIEPNIAGTDYLPDSFTLEYDFRMHVSYSFGFEYEHTCNVMVFGIDHASDGWVIGSVCPDGDRSFTKENLPWFQPKKWHHFAISYNNDEIKCYLDNKKVMTRTGCGLNPSGFWLHPGYKDYLLFTNIRLATGPYTKTTNFNKLLTDNKFTTHAILFDANKADIKTESANFVKQLAEWLKANSMVKLEIDGHTDSDGSAAANMRLSQDRADEVKKVLVLQGIDSRRLTSKGFGSTKPIRPNTTPEGKAENRRVEFIKR